MIKVFKNYVLNIFIVVAFFLSQVMTVNANYLKNGPQREESSFSRMEQGGKNAINMAAFYLPSLNNEMENNVIPEGKIEKVLEPISIGVFGFGMAIGYASTALGLFLGWLISIIRAAKR
ncbi:hypothetical protein [Bartonella gliris]|uniref:hypothetical protein n=1 Tax=Bartonella gliris TaxID=3004109 RepID=UPI00295E7998|nr:hypothetical protein [Bartonella gliris]